MARLTKEQHEAKLRRELIEKILGWKFGGAGLIAEQRVSTMRATLETQPTVVLLEMEKELRGVLSRAVAVFSRRRSKG
jgi:hypothetical protein